MSSRTNLPVLRALAVTMSGITNCAWAMLVFLGEIPIPSGGYKLPALSAMIGVLAIGYAIHGLRQAKV